MDPWSAALIAALDKVRPGVVHIEARTPNTNQFAIGTGTILDHYHIIASAQVVAMEDQVTVKTADGKQRPARCIGLDPLYFLAILRVEEQLPFEPPVFAPEGTTPVGLHVFAVGYALGDEQTVASGVIASRDRTIYRPGRGSGNFPVDGLLVTTAPNHPGNTGGPLVDLEGRVVGVNGLQWQGGLSLAVQAAVAGRIASQIIDYGQAVHPWLGFSGEGDVIDHMWVDLFSLPVDRGVLIQSVNVIGPGYEAGLEARDMVLAVDGHQPIFNTGAIRKILSHHKPGDKVPIKVLRKGEVMDVELTVSEMPHLSDLFQADGEDEERYSEDDNE